MGTMKASDYIVRFLRDRGVEIVFGYSGGAITHLMDSLNKGSGIRFLQTYHEQTAAIAAEGYSWLSGTLGVALATSGPGALNLINGIADAYFDSIPTLYITGQVNTYEYKGDKPIRQQGFQETDIVSIVRPITKYATMISDPAQIRYELEKAWSMATNGRRGPVLLDIPMDVQRSEIDENLLSSYDAGVPNPNASALRYLNAFTPEKLGVLIKNSQRPLILLGSGVALAGAKKEAVALINRFRIPVVTSLLGKAIFPENNDLNIGMIGSYGNRCANLAVANADLLLVIGARLDTRQTGTNLASFVRSGIVVRLDIDEDEIANHRLENILSVVGDAKEFLAVLDNMDWDQPREDWIAYLSRLKEAYGQDAEVARNIINKSPYAVMDILNNLSAADQIFTVDIGQNQMFAAQKLKLREGQEWKTSGGLAPMGFALPAAIGAAFATQRKRPIFAITGDGGLFISAQSLLLIAQYKLPIKIILLNNRSLGMITQFQDLYFDQRREGTTKDTGYLVPDFSLLARSCGLDYLLVQAKDIGADSAYVQALSSVGPMLVEFDVGENTVVYPKLEVNMPMEDLNPKLPREELHGLMRIGNESKGVA